MRILDLFCGVGGASMGISRAGHKVVGVDLYPQPNYPFEFIQEDALKVSLDGYDAFHASPPCQKYSYATSQWRELGNEYPDLIAQIRQRLLETGKPFVIENVVGAPIRKDLLLCMSMFDDGRKFMVRRHRIFEVSGFEVPQPEHIKHVGRVGDGRILSVFGHGGGTKYNHCSSNLEDWKTSMGLPWAQKRREVTEAIPPEYTQYIFSFLK
jgi:hypothetical protein